MPNTSTTALPHIIISCEDEAMRDGLRELQKALPGILQKNSRIELKLALEDALALLVHTVMDSRIPELRPTEMQSLESPYSMQDGIQSEDCLAIATWVGGAQHGEHAGQILLNATEKHIADMRTHTTIELRSSDQRIGLAHGRINPDATTVDWYCFMVTGDMSTDNAAPWAAILGQILTPDAEVLTSSGLNSTTHP